MKIDLEVNKIVKYLILGDLVFEASWGLISPIFAIFIVEKIVGGNTLVAGLASAINLALFSIVRIPLAVFLDKTPREEDDFLLMFLGFLFASFVPFGFIFSKFPWQIYILQAISGISTAAAFAGYMSIFTKNIDKEKVATEWGIRASSISLAMGLTAGIGGKLAMKFGFNFVFFLVGILSLIGSLLIFSLKKAILKYEKQRNSKNTL